MSNANIERLFLKIKEGDRYYPLACEAEKEYDELHLQLEQLGQSFSLREKADQRARERWREETGEELVIPDHVDLCVWLMSKLNRYEETLKWYEKQTSDCRKLSTIGDQARSNLDSDGGRRARRVLYEEQE